jgi:radical SAM protein with 4Fe4S-binding SPASM domain
MVGSNRDSFLDEVGLTRGFNMLTSPFSIIGRGFGCSMQSTLNLTMHNLALVPCHRSGYKSNVTGYFDFFEDGSYDFKPNNVELYLSEQSAVATQIAPCSACPINLLCSGTCIGSNIEETGDPYTAPPSVCRMEHIKTAAIIKGMDEINVLDFYLRNVDSKRASQILFVLENFQEF